MFTRSDYTDRAVAVWMNHGGGNFVDETSERINYVTQTGGWIKYINFADFNGDGALDFITEPAGGSSEVLINNGDGFFFRPTDAVQTFTGSSFEVGDFTGDGRPDVAAWGGSNLLLFALQDGPTYPFIGDAGDNSIYGDARGNSLDGGGGADTLRAGSGNDLLNGGNGADSLFGGTGADKFVFDAVALSDAQSAVIDRVRDYDRGGGAYDPAEGDQIDLSALLATAYNHGSDQPVSSLVRAIEAASRTFADLEIDPDGTANGVHWTRIARIDGAKIGDPVNIILNSTLAGGSTIKVGAGTVAIRDFNGDGHSDLLWQNDNGQAAIWLMDGATPLAQSASRRQSRPTWHAKGAGDFNGDGKTDILWQNDNGQAAIWLMNGTNVDRRSGSRPQSGPELARHGRRRFQRRRQDRHPLAERQWSGRRSG